MSKNRIEELLKEFTRITGTGNMRASAALLPEIIMHLVDMVEAVADRVDGGSSRDEIKGLLKDYYEAPAPVEAPVEAAPVAEVAPVVAEPKAEPKAKKATVRKAPAKKDVTLVVPVEPKKPARRSKPKA